MPRDKSRYRDKRSSSCSSESSYDRKKSKSKHKRSSRSKDRPESRSKRRRSSSRSKHRRKSYSRSVSRDRHELNSRRRSSSRSRSKRSNRTSRDKSRSTSRSHSKSKHSKIKKSHRRSRSSSSHGSSFDIDRPLPSKKINMDDIESKVEKAIKAAEAAGLTMTKIPTYEYKEVEIKEEMPTIHDRNLLAEINNDSFAPKAFTSSKNKKQQNIVINLDTDTVKLPNTELKVQKDDTILDFSAIPSEEVLREMWIKKLYHFRKKMLKEEI